MSFFNDWDACPISQFSDGVNKGEVFVLHQEVESAAAGITAETFVALSGGVDIERGSLLAVERAVDLEIRTGSLEWEISSDQVDNIRRLKDTFDCFSRNHSHARSVNRMFGLRQPWVRFLL